MNNLTNRFKEAYENPTIDSKKRSSTYHPSSASIEVEENGAKRVIGGCIRQQWYRIKSEGCTNPGITDHAISADIGEKLHLLIEDYLDTHGFKMGIQKIKAESVIYDKELNLSGRSDILAWDHLNNELIGIEVKSVGEYKAGKCAEAPDETHVMQAMIYLDFYNKHIPEGMPRPKKWYIWYISRTENWTIKARKHGSPLQMLWDYYITLDEEGIPNIYSAHNTERWAHLSVEKIKERYSDLDYFVTENVLPPRDFEIKYSEERLVDMYKRDQIPTKRDKEIIRKWLAKGAPEGDLKIDMGDFACRFCDWKDHCWEGKDNKVKSDFNLPKKEASNSPNTNSNFFNGEITL